MALVFGSCVRGLEREVMRKTWKTLAGQLGCVAQGYEEEDIVSDDVQCDLKCRV